jgi:hypothetical protein
MERKEVSEVLECLSGDRDVFYYFRDRYAVELLSWFAGGGKTIREIKSSRYSRLLNKDVVRQACAAAGGGSVGAMDLAAAWPAQPGAYVLTLGQWPHEEPRRRWWHWYNQTSRSGANIVLQLNFPSAHDRRYDALIGPLERHPFEYGKHPINRTGRHTLAWARLDADMRSGEALIEEIQTDWVRRARGLAITVERFEKEGGDCRRVVHEKLGVDWEPERLRDYVDKVLSPHAAVWDEATMLAAIMFAKRELGAKRVFYHTQDFGAAIKHMWGEGPPHSLYATLPRRFCFEETLEWPSFLNREVRRLGDRRRGREWKARFFVLDL